MTSLGCRRSGPVEPLFRGTHAGSVQGLALGTGSLLWQLASGSSDGTIKVWDTRLWGNTCLRNRASRQFKDTSPEPGHCLQPRTGGMLNQPQWRTGTAKVWDAAFGQEVQMLKGHVGQISSVAYSPDGKQLVSGSFDGMVSRCGIRRRGGCYRRCGHYSRPLKDFVHGVSVVYSPDSQRLASSGGDGMQEGVWDADDGSRVIAPGAVTGRSNMGPVPIKVYRYEPGWAAVGERRPGRDGQGLGRGLMGQERSERLARAYPRPVHGAWSYQSRWTVADERR